MLTVRCLCRLSVCLWPVAAAVSELVSALKPALLAQYELDASVSGSGYSARMQSQAAIAAAAATATAAAAAAAAAAEEEPSLSGGASGPKLHRPASGSHDDAGVVAGSSEEEGRHHLRVHGATSRRNSAPSVAPHSTPSVAPRPSHALLTSPSPLFFPSTAAQHGATAVEPEAPLVVPDPTAIDVVTSEHATARLLWAWETQLEHEYRLFSLLEHSLKKPYLLSVHHCVLQLSFQMSLQLTNMYYDFDKAFMRQLMGQKLSTKTRGKIHDMQHKMAEERNAAEVERRRRANLDYPPQPTPQQQHRARRNSQSVASLSTLLGSVGGAADGTSGVSPLISYPLGSAHSDCDLASTLTSNQDEGPTVLDPSAPSVGEVRFSSCCRQFDNLRRIYRCRWGEKGDGVVDETDLRMDDWDAGTSLLHSTIRAGAASAELQSLSAAGMAPMGSARARELMLGERWRAMRAAAIAAMAKRGFGSDKAAATTAATSSTANAAADAAALKAQQWMLRHFDGSGGAGGSNAGVSLGGGLDSFFGLDMSAQAMRLADQTAPVFYQQQFRLHSSLARSYSRLIFLAHYRIGVSLAIKRKKKQFDMLSFDEVQLLAQILMRCWAVPVGSAALAADEAMLDEPLLARQDSSRAPVDPSPFSVSLASGAPPSNPAMAAGGTSSAFFPQSISPNLRPAAGPAASLTTLPIDSAAGALASTSNANMFAGPTAVSRMVTAESTSRAALRRLSVDESAVAAPSLYILSPLSPDASTLHSSSTPPSHRSVSGAACAGYDFLPIVSQMRASDEDVWVGDALDGDFIHGLADLKSQMGSKLLDEYAAGIGKMFRDTIQLHASNSAAGAAASPVAPLGASSTTAGAAAAAGDVCAPIASSLRPSVLAKLLSRIPALLKSLHSLAVSLHKSKRLRTLLSDLIEDVLRPLLKQGAAAPAPLELLYFMRCVRDAVSALPSLMHLAIERNPLYPHPYERRQRQQAAAHDAMRRQHSVSTLATPSHAGALSTIAHAGSVSGAPTGGPTAADPLHRAIIHWCRFLDAVGPICVILYMKLSHATQETI